MKEKREHLRHASSEKTFYATKNELYECTIKDKDAECVKGVFVVTKKDISVGRVITVAVPASGQKKGKKLKGVVVRKSPDGFAVHFKNILNG
jgi:hypothetical protein